MNDDENDRKKTLAFRNRAKRKPVNIVQDESDGVPKMTLSYSESQSQNLPQTSRRAQTELNVSMLHVHECDPKEIQVHAWIPDRLDLTMQDGSYASVDYTKILLEINGILQFVAGATPPERDQGSASMLEKIARNEVKSCSAQINSELEVGKECNSDSRIFLLDDEIINFADGYLLKNMEGGAGEIKVMYDPTDKMRKAFKTARQMGYRDYDKMLSKSTYDEANILARLDHIPEIINHLESRMIDGKHYFATEYFENQTSHMIKAAKWAYDNGDKNAITRISSKVAPIPYVSSLFSTSKRSIGLSSPYSSDFPFRKIRGTTFGMMDCGETVVGVKPGLSVAPVSATLIAVPKSIATTTGATFLSSAVICPFGCIPLKVIPFS